MKKIVITGSSRGIGYGLAENFLKTGNCVVVSGSTKASTLKAYKKLVAKYENQVFMQYCNVTSLEEVENLCNKAEEFMGGIDIWINNAGINHISEPYNEMSDKMIHKVIDVNIYGALNGSKVALNHFQKMKSGALYNMEGLGSDGRIVVGFSMYGSTKRFLRYFSRSLAKEVEHSKVIVGRLSPGMVTTELLLKDLEQSENKEKAKKIFNILADTVETVTPFLCERILNNDKNGVLISWLNTRKIIFRFISSPFVNRNIL